MHLASHTEIESFLNQPGSTVSKVISIKRIQLTPLAADWKKKQLDRQREHWRKLHTTRLTPQEFELWIQSIPGCSSCQRDFRRIIKDHPPCYDEWERWTWEVHNLVNVKLGKPEVTWIEAIELWNWSTIKDINDGDTEDSS
jgi:hypothetical protein